ncbi:jasmonate-induced protein homolog [Silene latifolia]|uniref:jasmonate-induced protein homolog n=1 Tax=Silene latifolia TaxID=37657 RepID=UPI003D77EC5B
MQMGWRRTTQRDESKTINHTDPVFSTCRVLKSPSKRETMASAQMQKATNLDKANVFQPQNGTQVSLVNRTSFEMTLGRSISWSGTPAYPGFPEKILPNRFGLFSHLSDGDFGSTAAVIYYGTNSNFMPCAWVLAWDAPSESDQSPNKVFVFCGPQSTIESMEFREIRMLLNGSSTEAKATDTTSMTAAEANIHDHTTNKATVTASFSYMP